jgi:hypothetical protein
LPIFGDRTEVDDFIKRVERLYAVTKQTQDAMAEAAARDLGKDLLADLRGELERLNVELGISTEVSKADAVAKTLQTEAYRNLDQGTKDLIMSTARQVTEAQEALKAQQEAQAVYDKMVDRIYDSLRVLEEQGFGAFFKNILRQFKDWLLKMAAEWLASKFLKLLNSLGSGTAGAGGSSSFSLGSFLQGLFGGRGSAERGPAVHGPARAGDIPGLFGGVSSHVPVRRDSVGLPGGAGGSGSSSTSGGFTLANGIAVAGAAATILGGMIGGRVGGVISGAGQGLAMGAAIGSIIPGVGTAIGAAVGAVAGGLLGLLGGDPKRRIDKKENMPKLQKGFQDAIAELDKLKSDHQAIYNDPDGTLQRALEIKAQIAAGFGIEFQSKKYRRIAQQQIQQKLLEADELIKQLQELASRYRLARDIDERLNPSFASGVFMDRAFLQQFADFKRRNGMLPGQFTGRDTLPSLLAAGEMVLNPEQIDRVKRRAGFDVFRNAGIPGYASGIALPSSSTAPVVDTPAALPPITVQLVLKNSGIVESDIEDVIVNGFRENPELRVELVRAYDREKPRAG